MTIMNKRLISILVANLFVAAPAFAQDFTVEGAVSAGAINVRNKDDVVDASKLNEFRDLSSGGLSAVDIKGRGSAYWFDLFGENFGRDDQYIGVRGGADKTFKYWLSSDSLRHNFLFNGHTPYANPGSVDVRAPSAFPILNEGLWTALDVSYKRRDDAAGVEFKAFDPWYVRVEGNRVKTTGTKVGSSSQGTSPGNGYVDLAFPVDYETRNASVEGGYSTKTMHFSLSFLTSKFDNANESITWQNGYFGNGIDRTFLPPDNKYTRFAGNATIRKLPLNSTFAARFTSDELKSDAGLGTSVLGTTTGGNVATGPSTNSFNGKVENETFTLALASNPAKGLDTRLYYNYAKRDDKSTLIDYNAQGTTGAGGPFDNEHFSYKKKNWGFDAFYRLNRANRLGAGYDYLDTERERFDFDRSKDKKWFAEWKNSSLENLSARLKYTDLKRDSNFLLANDGVNSGDVLFWNRFLKAYDVTDLDQKNWKLVLDYSPMEFLDLSFEGTKKENKYRGQVLGRLDDKRQEYYFAVSYGDPASVRFTAFLDHERIEYNSRHRVTQFGSTALGTYDPATPDTASNYNWSGTNKDKNHAVGLTVDFPATEKLMVKGSVVHYRTDGSVDFAAPPLISAATYPQAIGAFDDSKRVSMNLKGIYTLSKQWSVTGGYAYEKYSYKDAQYDGYRYTIPASGRADSYLYGYLANPNFSNHIVYGMVSYKF
jgi:MtrB/PioB family decaheme-associated outer membrane protein